MAKKIKILHLMESFLVGGAEKVVFDLCKNLPVDQFSNYVVGLDSGAMEKDFAGVCATSCLIRKKRGFDLKFVVKLVSFIRENDIDIVHLVNGLTVVNYGFFVASILGKPSVVAVHGLSHFHEKTLGARMWRFIVTRSTFSIGVSNDILREIYKINKNKQKTALIYNSIKFDKLSVDDLNKNKFPNIFEGRTTPEFLITCVANLRKVKGHSFLIQAMKSVLDEFPKAQLLLIGSGEEEVLLREKASSLGIEGNVIFGGARNDVPDCLNVSDIFVLSSISEGLPLSILEAMNAKLPVVATNVGGIPEVVVSEKTGILVPPRDHRALSCAIIKLCNSSELRTSCGNEGFKFFEQKFAYNKFINNYVGFFSEAVN